MSSPFTKMEVMTHGCSLSPATCVAAVSYTHLDVYKRQGLMPAGELIKMMVIQAVLKTLYEIIILPVTIRVVNYIKKVDGSDVFDEHISYNVLKIKEL